MRNLLIEDTLTHSRVNGSQRWNLTLKGGGLHMTHRPGTIDVRQYHEAPLILESTSPTSVSEKNGRLGVVRDKIESILHDPAVRPTQLSIFAESLSFIYERDPQAILTHLLADRLRLFAGRLIVLTLQDETVWLPIEPTDRADRLAELESWEWDTTSYPEYRRQPSRNGYYKPSLDEHQEWHQIRLPHFAFLERWLEHSQVVDPRSAAQDEPLVVKYLSAVLHRSVPDTSSFTIPEEVPPYADYPEGGITRVTVNRFERSRAARKQCLQHMGYRCIVCKMSFGERYGSEVEGYTHVHHLVPQAQMRKRYVLKPEHDLVPVCPNCHAVLHAGGITRTIEAVQEMLRLAKARTEKGDAEA